MTDLIKDIVSKAKENTYFRQVLETGSHTQVVIMNIPSRGEIGEEIHPDSDQVLFLLSGMGEIILEGKKQPYEAGDLVLIRAGIKHNFINTGSEDLKIITTYSPPHHPQGTIHKTKTEADNVGY